MTRILKERTHVVNKAAFNWVPTDDIIAKVSETYPKLEFPWLEDEHIHGVDSVVTGICREHKQLIPMVVGNLWRGSTKYGCPECAYIAGEGSDTYSRFRNRPGYIGRSGMEFGLFCAIKEVFPDAIAGHRMSNRKEIDIWIPSIRAGVEYNGCYYHSEKVGRGVEYHIEKSLTGFSEDKMIFHVFTEEVEPFSRIIALLTLYSQVLESRNSGKVIGPQKRDFNVQSISEGIATSFHRDNEFIFDPLNRFCDIHVGVFNETFDMVAAFSGIRSLGLFNRMTITDPRVPIGGTIRWAKKAFGMGSAVVVANLRSPLHVILCNMDPGIKFDCRTAPRQILLNSNYEMFDPGYSSAEDIVNFNTTRHPLEATRAWDCGTFLYQLK